VQPADRIARGRDGFYGVGLAMSAEAPGDTRAQFEQFMEAYQANYVTSEGKLVIDDPDIRRRLIRTMDSYTAIYPKGCTPSVPRAGHRDDRQRDSLDPERA
jgi:multiple sugar transport system substrate-binding protein